MQQDEKFNRKRLMVFTFTKYVSGDHSCLYLTHSSSLTLPKLKRFKLTECPGVEEEFWRNNNQKEI